MFIPHVKQYKCSTAAFFFLSTDFYSTHTHPPGRSCDESSREAVTLLKRNAANRAWHELKGYWKHTPISRPRKNRSSKAVCVCVGMGVSFSSVCQLGLWRRGFVYLLAVAKPARDGGQKSYKTAPWRRWEAGRGQLVHCPMILLTNESSSSSSLIPTKWSTTSPPRMAITVGTAETWKQTKLWVIRQDW